MSQFDEKIAIVKGSGSRIDQRTAQFYAREGAKVVVSDFDVSGTLHEDVIVK